MDGMGPLNLSVTLNTSNAKLLNEVMPSEFGTAYFLLTTCSQSYSSNTWPENQDSDTSQFPHSVLLNVEKLERINIKFCYE